MRKQDETMPTADAGPVEREAGRPVEQRANAPQAHCPNPPFGRRCQLCGGELYCMNPWRARA